MNTEISVMVKAKNEWCKVIDIFYKMGYYWASNNINSPKEYKLNYFESKETYFLTANFLTRSGIISYCKDSKILHNIFTFKDFLKRYDIEELE